MTTMLMTAQQDQMVDKWEETTVSTKEIGSALDFLSPKCLWAGEVVMQVPVQVLTCLEALSHFTGTTQCIGHCP